MSVITDLVMKIRGKRQERFASTAEAYDAMVGKLAVGQDVDLDALAGLLDALDKSDGDLQSDVEAKHRRIEARAELDRLAELGKTLPPKRAKVAKLQEELNAFIAAKRPVIQALADEIRMLQLDCDRAAFVEHDLLNVGIPLSIQQRKDALAKRQRSLSEKQEEYRTRTESAVRAVDAAKVRLPDVELRLSKATIPYDIEAIRQEAEALQRRIGAYEQQISNWEPLKQEIEQEQASIYEEQQAIRKLLMTP